jgi:hypothetical protein
VVHLIALEQDRLDDVVADDLEVGLADVVLDVLLRAREEIVEAHDVIAARHEVIDEVRAHEARPAGHEHAVDALHAGARLRLDERLAVLIHRVARGIRDRARLERGAGDCDQIRRNSGGDDRAGGESRGREWRLI